MSDDLTTTTETTDLALPYLPDGGEGMISYAPPRLDWLHGVKAAKTPGVFYVKADELDGQPGEPWQPDDRFMSGDKPEMGFSAERLNVCFLGYRAQWFIPPPKNSNERTKWLTDYVADVGARKLVEYLVLVEGIADPVVLGLSKVSKSRPVKELLAHYRQTVLRQAARQYKRSSVPQYLFWIPIGGKVDEKGKPRYDEVTGATGDSSFVTYPVAHWPADVRSQMLDNETLRRIHDEILPQYRGWQHERRNNGEYTDADEYTIDETPALPPGRNVPVPIDDSDLPF